jgi:chaperonin GroEL
VKSRWRKRGGQGPNAVWDLYVQGQFRSLATLGQSGLAWGIERCLWGRGRTAGAYGSLCPAPTRHRIFLNNMVYRPKIDEKLCFVLMPFREPFNGYYEHIIKKAAQATGLEPLRGDEIFGTGSIIRDIWEHIWRARLVIADVTDRNPNVNYELGLCHALGVPTILITQEIEDVPFDYRHRRCIVYDTEQATWVDKLSAALVSTIGAVLSDGKGEHELEWPYDTSIAKQFAGGNSTISVENPRQIIIHGMAQVERLILKAFGPFGTNVSVGLSGHQIVSHKQGSVIANGVRSANPIEENGIEQMRKVSRLMSERVGDGTKTAMLLAHAFVAGGHSAISQGHPLKEVLDGMERALTVARSSIVEQTQPYSPDSLSAVALTASGDKGLSRMVIEAMGAAGEDGVILIDTKSGANAQLSIREGLRFDRGYLSDKFVTDATSGECELENCRLLIHEGKISNMRDLLPLLEEGVRAGQPFLIVADDVEGEALATLVVNRVRGTLACAAVRAPGSGDRRRALLEDIAILTGAKLLSYELGLRLDSVRLADLGSADRVVVSKNDTTIFGGKGSESAIQAHISALRAAIDRAYDAYDREKLQERLASLVGKIAIISVGGAADVDVEERRYRLASALYSARAAVEEGICYGGGTALLNANDAVAALTLQTDGQKAGASAISAALETPAIALAESCHKSPVTLLSERHRLANPKLGLNVETGDLEDMLASGILDPAKMLRAAIDSALSYARAVLKTDMWSVAAGPPESAL